MRSIGSFLAALALAVPAHAVAPRKTAVKPAPGSPLRSITIAPEKATLIGPRSEQALIVTGHFADGTLRDLTSLAQFRCADPRVIRLRVDATRRVVIPAADGAAAVTISVAGAASVSVPVEVKQFESDPPVSFRNEVIPALTKIGCSQGICHGTPTGKGGFRLSLQGYAPELDYHTLVLEANGRRINKADPGRSLVLLKPMVEVPHGGGKRLDPSMPEFKVLTRWIAQGAPNDTPATPTLTDVELIPGPRTLLLPDAKQNVAVMARFSDGSVRDVTPLAKLTVSDDDAATVSREGLVEGQRRAGIAVVARYQEQIRTLPVTFVENVAGFKWSYPPEFNYIDKAVYDRLKLFQIPASDLSSDTEFIRRAYLDATATLPMPEEVRAFLADRSPDKRAKLIDELTTRPEFADFWALKWADVLRITDETLHEGPARAYFKWVRDGIAANKPYDQFVRELLTAKGGTLDVPPAGYFRAVESTDELCQATSQVFLGVRMLCAKCHNHPFERWTQDEYYSFAAFFAPVKSRGSRRSDEDTVYLDPEGEVVHPRTNKVMQPKLLGAEYPKLKEGEDPRIALAAWMTRRDNPFVPREMVNRVWANLLGRGLVEPIDDFRASNPPTNEPLLDALAKDFVDHNFDFRYLVRTIMKSRTYQASARTQPLNKDDSLYYSHALPRLMSAEQLADAISQFTGVPDEYEGYPAGTRAIQIAGTKARSPFLKLFGRPDRNLNCECEREKDPTLFQALALINGRSVHNKLHADDGRIAKLAASQKPTGEAIEELYLAAVARVPSPREKQELVSYVEKAPDHRQAYEDLGWALINAKEFQFRH